jgi:hypothetical protein
MARMKLTSTDPRRITVRIPEDTPAARKAARSLAMREAGTVAIGALQSCDPVKGGYALTWTPNHARNAKPVATPRPVPRKRTEAPVANPTELLTLALQGDRVSAERLMALIGAPATPAPVTPKREAPAFLAKRENVTCEACQDYGVVRKHGKDAGKAYKTANGAQAATANGNSTPCTAKAHKHGKRAA